MKLLRNFTTAQLGGYLEALAPLLLTLLIFVMYDMLIDALVLCGSTLAAGCQAINITQLLKDNNLCCFNTAGAVKATVIQGRFLWLFTVGLNILACVGTVMIGVYIVWNVIAGRSRRYQQAFAGSMILLTLLAFVLFLSREPNINSLVRCSADYTNNRLVNQFLACTATIELPSVIAVSNWIIALSYTSAFLLVLLSSAILWPVEKERQTSEAEISKRTKLLRVLLYTGMVQLVTSTLRLSTTFHWATSFLPLDDKNPASGPLIKAVVGLATTLTYIEAATYTLILVAVYLPAILILRSRACKLITSDEFQAEPAREKWLQERGLALSISVYIPRLVALLAPLLAGPMSDMVMRFIQ
jgi:hypothetical protein